MLDVEDLSVEFAGRRVLDGVSFQVDSGGWLALVGPNGAGKTTLIRALVGLIPGAGVIAVNGEIRQLRARRHAARLVAYVPQRPVLPPAMRVADYVMLGRAAHQPLLGGESGRDREAVSRVLHRLDLRELAERRLGQISGGEAQRAVLARALAQEAPVLALDEPTASLDLGHSQLVLELTDELREERGLSVVAALHDLNLAALYAERVLLLSSGRIVAAGTPEEVLTEQQLEGVFQASLRVEWVGGELRITTVRPPRVTRSRTIG